MNGVAWYSPGDSSMDVLLGTLCSLAAVVAAVASQCGRSLVGTAWMLAGLSGRINSHFVICPSP